jgi:hypothetical protein
MATAHATGRTVTIVSNDSSAAAGTNKLPDYAVQGVGKVILDGGLRGGTPVMNG